MKIAAISARIAATTAKTFATRGTRAVGVIGERTVGIFARIAAIYERTGATTAKIDAIAGAEPALARTRDFERRRTASVAHLEPRGPWDLCFACGSA